MTPFVKISKLTGTLLLVLSLALNAADTPKRVDVKQLSKKVEDVVVRQGEPLLFFRGKYRNIGEDAADSD